MTALDHARSAGAFILKEKESLAARVTARLYDEKPALLEKHGERGREKCLQDMHYNIEHLLPAVELDDANLFARYVTWLDDMLRARGVATDDVIRCLTLLRKECVGQYAEDGAFIARIIDAGIDSLGGAQA